MVKVSAIGLLVGAASLPFTLVSAAANQLQHVTVDFGYNPTNVGFHIYLPTKLADRPPILVNPHWCHGKASDAFAGSQYATLADKYGFIVIYPDSPHEADKCWDVSSSQTLTHQGGGDSQGIVSMVRYVIQKYNANPDRVFATGVSSGAMMTNVLLGSYPDVFTAGSAFAGVAFGCFSGNGYAVWNDACAKGQVVKTGAEWKSMVDAAYPGYTGYRPKMQVFHGTADEVLNIQNLDEEIKQWTAVFGLPSSPVQSYPNTPLSGWTKKIYGDKFEAYSAQGVSHNIPNQETIAMAWFDLTCVGTTYCFSRQGGSGPWPTVTPTGTTPTSTTPPVQSSSTAVVPTPTTSTTPPVPTTTVPSGGAGKWGQCGGMGFTGPTYCAAGAGTCHYVNDWYSQCY
ncbi:hypothetical protein V496_02053 [Pseudogymnoascus sp. VKM F-4515 (FW-2607)]|nr:hypothetical protein V496_02053 [Pseudogymnoascus sp. VKM F-4515 (FW-2607)]KFY89943.1 hypothetical protein V498_06243 [Pseudogymnoascus sp. VKM F-4517 (FW-2822)]